MNGKYATEGYLIARENKSQQIKRESDRYRAVMNGYMTAWRTHDPCESNISKILRSLGHTNLCCVPGGNLDTIVDLPVSELSKVPKELLVETRDQLVKIKAIIDKIESINIPTDIPTDIAKLLPKNYNRPNCHLSVIDKDIFAFDSAIAFTQLSHQEDQ